MKINNLWLASLLTGCISIPTLAQPEYDRENIRTEQLSRGIVAGAAVVHKLYTGPLPPGRKSLDEALREHGRIGIEGIDTRALTLKLREDVLVAFEEGDFEHMPQSGYAQGMLSSYARYLGLNAREIVDLFQEELYEHRHGSSSHELRRRTRQTQAGRNISFISCKSRK